MENIPLNFEIDSGFAHFAISYKLYLKHFKNEPFQKNYLALKDYVGVSFKPLAFLNLNGICEEQIFVLKTYVIQGPPVIGRNDLFMFKIGLCTIGMHNHADNSILNMYSLDKKYSV